MNLDDFFLGFGSSLAATLFVWAFCEAKKNRALRAKYGRCVGKYEGFCYEDGKQKSHPESDAVVTYLRDNVLKLRLTEKAGPVWEGILTMETEDNGTVVFQYVAPEGKYEFGFKRCIWNGKDKLYLVGERLGGYHYEVLIKPPAAV